MKKHLFNLWLLLVLCIFVEASSAAQIILPPKPKKVLPEKRVKLKKERLPIVSIPARGWHMETGVGIAVWGTDSQCGCNAIVADIGMHYISKRGLLIGSQLLVTSTVSTNASPLLKIGYQSVNKRDGSIGIWSASVLGGPTIGSLKNSLFNETNKYSGYVYGGELSFQPRVGKFSQLRGVFSLGWLTQREAFTSRDWGGGSILTKTVHSGLRIKFGITI